MFTPSPTARALFLRLGPTASTGARALTIAVALGALGLSPAASSAPPPGRVAARSEGAPVDGALGPDVDLEKRVPALVERLKIPSERKAARAEIIALGKPATPYLLPRFDDPDFTVRWEMTNIQGDLQDERALPALVDRVLRDENPHVRWRAIWALRELPREREEPALEMLRKATEDADAGTRWNAAIGVSMFGDDSTVPMLHAGLEDPDDWRRWEALNALGRVHDAGSISLLRGRLPLEDVRFRNEAVLSIGKIGGPEALEALLPALRDPSPDVRWRVAMSLAVVGDPRAVPALNAHLPTETDPQVRKHVEKALKRLGRGR